MYSLSYLHFAAITNTKDEMKYKWYMALGQQLVKRGLINSFFPLHYKLFAYSPSFIKPNVLCIYQSVIIFTVSYN